MMYDVDTEKACLGVGFGFREREERWREHQHSAPRGLRRQMFRAELLMRVFGRGLEAVGAKPSGGG